MKYRNLLLAIGTLLLSGQAGSPARQSPATRQTTAAPQALATRQVAVATSVPAARQAAIAPPATATRQTNPHGDIKMSCTDCHSPKRWKPTKRILDFDHGKTGFPLSGSHASVSCTDCHKDLKFQSVSSACADCHKDIHKGKFGNDCQACHTTKKWSKEFLTVEAQAHTRFPLVGFHAIDECAKCHKNQEPKNYANTPTTCNSCHMAEFDKTKSPNHRASNFSTDCVSCHASAILTGWTSGASAGGMMHPATLPLTGAHGKISCYACHRKDTFSGLNPQCASCHQKDYDGTANPNHKQLAFPIECATCHSNQNWNVAAIPDGIQFKHPADFPLAGGHAKPKCADCHAKGYVNTPAECVSCHKTDFDKTKSPNHTDLKFPTDCKQCHTIDMWKGAKIDPSTPFNHPATFPLTGGHAKPACVDCHAQGYAGTKSECASCHDKDYKATTDPNHVQQKFSTDCKQCHTTGAWKGAMIPPGSNFQHPATFPLNGGHAVAACADCHKNGSYTNTPTDCFTCHKANYDTTRSPDHTKLAFGTNCAECHTTTNWLGAVIPPNHPFQHPATFPLDGGHSQVDCAKCHAQGYSNTPTQCASCHDKDYKATVNPNHIDLKFSTDCKQCHTVNKDWKGATIPPNSGFQHPATFQLVGGHAKPSCSACHANGYANTPVECVACHKTDFDKTTSPSHSSLNFSTDCKQCHTVNAWKGATIPPGTNFQHPATFPLTAGHANVSCMECHANGYTNTPKDCNSCHNADYVKAVPNHTNLKLPTDCSLCHTTAAWTGATIPAGIPINHPSTFPLTAPHDKATCVQCHAAGYTKTSTDCYSCHKADYQGAKSPDHVASGFSTNCLSCHKPTTWDGATFDHSKYFPIASGRHSGFQCTECHTTANNYKAFECILCHAHSNKANVDGDHRGVGGYRYTSEGCYSCHPRGNGG